VTVSTIYVGMDGWVSEAVPTQVNGATRGLKLDATAGDQKFAYLWFQLPFTVGNEVDVSDASFTFNLRDAPSATRIFNARRISETWSARNLRWNNKPATTGNDHEVTITAGAQTGDEFSIDITNAIAFVGNGSADWYGLRLETETGGPFSIWSQQALNRNFRPRIEVTWSEVPDAPRDLSPAGGRVVSKARPNLGWTVRGNHGETAQVLAQVQLSTASDMSDITFDSGLVPLDETEIDLSEAAYSAPSIADGDTRYWRVRYEDDQGRLSDWSDTAHFTRMQQGTLSILNPVDGATVEDTTPEILLDFSGATLEATALFLDKVDEDGGTWVELWRRPRTVSTDLSITIPPGHVRRTTDQYRIRARAWDDQDREWRPGDPMWVQATALFTFDTTAAVDPVDTITAAQHANGSPVVDIVVTTDDAPDYFSLVVDGDRELTRIDPEDVVTGTGEYTILYDRAPAKVTLTYEVERVLNIGGVLKHSRNNPSVDFESVPIGIWLWDVDEPQFDVVMEGNDDGADFDWGETAGVFFPAGKYPQAPVRLLQSTRGREGTVSGAIRSNSPVTARAYLSRLRKVWRSGRTMRLVMGEVNIPVVIGEPHDAPLDEPDAAYQVSFKVYQVEDFDR